MHLLDSSVLIALVQAEHVHAEAAATWFEALEVDVRDLSHHAGCAAAAAVA